jgi:hypothetical protein
MISSMMADLQSNTNQEAVAKMAAIASSEQTQGFGSILNPPSNSESDVKFKNSYQQLSETNKKIINKVANVMERNFNSSDIQTCISNVTTAQGVKVIGAKAANASIVVNQESAAELLMQCLQNSSVASSVTDALMTEFKVKDVTSTTQASSFTAEAEAKAKSENRGIFESLGAMFGGLFGDPWIVIGCCICLLVLSMLAGAYYYFKTGGMDDDDFYGGGSNNIMHSIKNLFKINSKSNPFTSSVSLSISSSDLV